MITPQKMSYEGSIYRYTCAKCKKIEYPVQFFNDDKKPKRFVPNLFLKCIIDAYLDSGFRFSFG